MSLTREFIKLAKQTKTTTTSNNNNIGPQQPSTEPSWLKAMQSGKETINKGFRLKSDVNELQKWFALSQKPEVKRLYNHGKAVYDRAKSQNFQGTKNIPRNAATAITNLGLRPKSSPWTPVSPLSRIVQMICAPRTTAARKGLIASGKYVTRSIANQLGDGFKGIKKDIDTLLENPDNAEAANNIYNESSKLNTNGGLYEWAKWLMEERPKTTEAPVVSLLKAVNQPGVNPVNAGLQEAQRLTFEGVTNNAKSDLKNIGTNSVSLLTNPANAKAVNDIFDKANKYRWAELYGSEAIRHLVSSTADVSKTLTRFPTSESVGLFNYFANGQPTGFTARALDAVGPAFDVAEDTKWFAANKLLKAWGGKLGKRIASGPLLPALTIADGADLGAKVQDYNDIYANGFTYNPDNNEYSAPITVNGKKTNAVYYPGMRLPHNYFSGTGMPTMLENGEMIYTNNRPRTWSEWGNAWKDWYNGDRQKAINAFTPQIGENGKAVYAPDLTVTGVESWSPGLADFIGLNKQRRAVEQQRYLREHAKKNDYQSSAPTLNQEYRGIINSDVLEGTDLSEEDKNYLRRVMPQNRTLSSIMSRQR